MKNIIVSQTTIAYIARRITDSRAPLADRAALCRWARGCCWAEQIERLVAVVARDQAFAARCRN